MPFIPTYTGDGAVVLSLGVMTMVLVLMTKIVVFQIRRLMDYNARIEETVSEFLLSDTYIHPSTAKEAN